ncbi:MAG: YidC/Oxa1 family membrane protein insertase [Candidatus Daviesbacteria bacterium]|nr:YidC/Oxa1 family membrane protein insertase [Candidatus Daviesbacteria bacterium]
MQIIGDIFNTVLFAPILNLLVAILKGAEFIHLPGALGLSIILLTVLIRLLVWPFMQTQLKSARKMAELKPHLDFLKTKHKGDKQALASAQMALYKEHGINPAGGCIPALIQIPIIIALYQTILAFFNTSGLENINKALYVKDWHFLTPPNLDFFGLNLATKPSDFGQYGILLLLIPVVTGALQLIQSKMMAPEKPIKEYPSDSPKEKKEKESTEDSMAMMQSQMMFMMPLMVGYFAFSFPIGLALYWNTFTVLGIIQQYKISGWGGLKDWIKYIKSKTNLNS